MEADEFATVVRAVAAFHETDVDLSVVAVPTLVLYGEREPPVLRRQASKLVAQTSDTAVRGSPGPVRPRTR